MVGIDALMAQHQQLINRLDALNNRLDTLQEGCVLCIISR